MTDIMSEIILNNARREKNTLSKYACPNRKGERKEEKTEKIKDRINIRPVFFH